MKKRLCPRCPLGTLQIKCSSRGYYYKCNSCNYSTDRAAVNSFEDRDDEIVSLPIYKSTSKVS